MVPSGFSVWEITAGLRVIVTFASESTYSRRPARPYTFRVVSDTWALPSISISVVKRLKYKLSHHPSCSSDITCTLSAKKNNSIPLSYQPASDESILSSFHTFVARPNVARSRSDSYTRSFVFTKIESVNIFTSVSKVKVLIFES